jgi:hypothetical protein
MEKNKNKTKRSKHLAINNIMKSNNMDHNTRSRNGNTVQTVDYNRAILDEAETSIQANFQY